MPQRQQTQGDFGLRPTKVTQGITDVYSTPSIPKPDNSGLEAIANLSKTAMGLIKEQHNLDIAHKKEGLAYGEANPNATLEEGGGLFTKGTTEAAMAGFQQGRGNTLRDTFRANVTGEWATLQEQNEDLKLQEDAYPTFIAQREQQFVQENNLDGIALSSFAQGREDWMLGEMHKNNLNSVKYRKEVFKTDMKEVTASAIGHLNNIMEMVDWSSSEEAMQYIEGSFVDENDGGGHLSFEDGTTLAYRDMRQEDFDNPNIMNALRDKVRNDAVNLNVVPRIQEVLQMGYNIGGVTEQTVRASVADDLIAALKDGDNPEEAWMVLSNLKSGTGLFLHTKEFSAKYEENREAIDKNRLNSRYAYNLQIDMFKLANSVDASTTVEQLEEAIGRVRGARGNYLTDDEAYNLETTMLKNWDSHSGERDDIATGAYYAQQALSRDAYSGDFSTKSVSDHINLLADKGYKVTREEVLNGVEDAIFYAGSKLMEEGGDVTQGANFIVAAIKRNGVFSGNKPPTLTHQLQNVASLITGNERVNNLGYVAQGVALYAAAESQGLLSSLSLSKEETAMYEYIQYKMLVDKADLPSAIAAVEAVKADFGIVHDEVSNADVREALPKEASSGRMQMTLDLARGIQLEQGLTGEVAVAAALKIQKENGITTIGEGRAEHTFQLTSGRTQADATFNAAAHHFNGALVLRTRRSFIADEKKLDEIYEKMTAVGGSWDRFNEAMFIEQSRQDRGKQSLGGLAVFNLKKQFEENARIAAREMFVKETGRQPMQASNTFRNVDMDHHNPMIGITSTLDLNQEPIYSFSNLVTGEKIQRIGEEEVQDFYTAEEMVLWLDEDVKVFRNDMLNRAEKEARERAELGAFILESY